MSKPIFQKTDAVTHRKIRNRNGVVTEVITANAPPFRYRVVWPADRMRETVEVEADLAPLEGGRHRRGRTVTNTFEGTLNGTLIQSGDGTFNDE